jgi:hypothetical protein
MVGHPDGWRKIVIDLVEKIRLTGVDIQVNQTKEKFGTLRFYYSLLDPEHTRTDHAHQVRRLVDEAEEESSRTCETCGKPGKLRTQFSWVKTLCDEHSVEREQRRTTR